MKHSLHKPLRGVLAAIFLNALCFSSGGQVVVWGNNSAGQLYVPASVTNVIALAAGDEHCLALRADGTVVAWGANGLGQTNVPSDLTNAVSVAAGSAHSLALRSDGTVPYWGHVLGTAFGSTLPPEMTNVVGLALGPGAQHVLALRSDGTVVDWGVGGHGLDNIPPAAQHAVAVAAGAYHGVALRSDGNVVAWGDNSYGQTNVPANATNIVAIAAGWFYNAAIRVDGTILVWGISTPPASLGFTNVFDVVCPFSGSSSCVLGLRGDGTLVQWQGSSVPADAATNIAAIAAGSYDALASVASGVPRFPGVPANRSVVFGASAYLRMKAVGGLPLFYQWSCNGTNISGATNSVLALTNVQLNLAGSYYTLVASNQFGMGTSGPITLNATPSEVTMLPQTVTVFPGTNVTFAASVTGQGPFSYQWQFDGTNLDGATNNPLILTNVQVVETGTYSLIVSNALGVVTNNAVLSVVPLLITVQPPNQLILAATNATFTASATGHGPFSYQWQFDGTNLDGATNNPLILTNVQMNQAGLYSVLGSNAFGVALSANSILSVVPLLITSQPQNQTVPVGTNATFTLAVNSQVPVDYQWQFDGTNLDGATNNPLILTNVQPNQAGVYSAIVSNVFGSVAVTNATLVVIPLTIASQPQSLVGFLGVTIAFNVVPMFQGPFSFQWEFNGTNIAGATDSSLVLTNLQLSQAGVYSVLVSNSFGGLQSADAVLSVQQVAAWGYNGYGQTNVPSGLTNAIAVAGCYHSMALKADGTVEAWGLNNYGQTNVPLDLTNVIAIEAGNSHSLALIADGTVRAWGDYFNGLNYYPAVPPAGLTNVVAIAAGWFHALALKADGTVVAWGYNQYYGQTNMPPGLTDIVAIAGGGFYSMALKADGTLVAWGGQGWGETNIPPMLSNVVAIAAGYSHGLALKADGTVIGWGDNSYGETNAPVGLTNVVAIAAGWVYSMALQADGTLVAWGGQGYGETKVPPGLTSAREMAAGASHGLALPGVPILQGRISNPTFAANQFRLSLPTQCGRAYALEYKNSLSGTNWTALPLAAGNGGMLTLTDPTNTDAERFYRVRRW